MENIKDKIVVIRNMKINGYTEKSIIKSNIDFFEKYPVLCRMAMDPSFDMKYLDYMLEMKNKVTQDNLEEMDKTVYNTLMKDYMPPEFMESNQNSI